MLNPVVPLSFNSLEEDATTILLQGLGLFYDPFQSIESSSDGRLSEYIVGHESFEIAWENTPALITAPAGGGKTAMRIYTARACWAGLGGQHPFPIPYLLSNYRFNDQPPTLDQHMAAILQAGASALLIGLAFRPEYFTDLPNGSRRIITDTLQRNLPGSLAYYLDILRENGTPLALPPLLDRAYRLPTPPDRESLLALCAALNDSISVSFNEPHRSVSAEFDEFIGLLLGPLKFRNCYLLLDGVDGFPETMASPAVAAKWIEPLLAQVPIWAGQRVFLKGFLPLELEPYLAPQDMVRLMRRAQLRWEPNLLAELIRRRVYAASSGAFGSLDAVASSALRDVETIIAKAVIPLPREAILVARRFLWQYAQRTQGRPGRLEAEDLDAALAWYQSQQILSIIDTGIREGAEAHQAPA